MHRQVHALCNYFHVPVGFIFFNLGKLDKKSEANRQCRIFFTVTFEAVH